MAEKLTEQQQMAVDNRGGKLLVSAAAGSGKTKVLVDRVLKYITDDKDPANVDDFLMITFTEAAASELRGKIAAKLSEHIAADPTNHHLRRQMQRLYLAKVSTVHAFCGDLLRDYAYKLDIPGDFHVGDENECIQLREMALQLALEEAYSNIQDNPDFQRFVDSQGAGRNDGLLEEVVLSVYKNSRCYIDPDDWLQSCIDNSDVTGISDASDTVWGKYLIEDLKLYLKEQIKAMERCCAAVAKIPEQDKAVAVLKENTELLRNISNLSCWDSFVENKNFSFGTLTFKKKSMDEDTARYVKSVRDNCKEILKSKLSRFYDFSQQVLKDLCDCAVAARGLVGVVRAFDDHYSRLKRMRHILDFNDLEQYTLVLLLGKNKNSVTAAAGEISKRFRQIMVDEYQDTNEVQDKIFSVLSMDKDNLFMVGDVKQCIYQFRLADPRIFLKKYSDFVPAESAQPGQGRKVLLSSNFRSGRAVLNAVNDVFRLCMSPQVGGMYYGDEEALREGIEHIGLGEAEVELHGIVTKESTYDEEAEFVAERIATLLDGTHMIREKDGLRPICADDIVILLRSPGTTGSYFQHALESRGINCNCGGSENLLTMPEVEVLHAMLQIISNPRQDIPLLTVLASPVFGFTADDLASLRAQNRYSNLYEAVSGSRYEKCTRFVEIFTYLRKRVAAVTLPELISDILNVTKMDALYAAQRDGHKAKKNLLAFYQYASGYSGQNGRNLDGFLRHLETVQSSGLSVENESPAGCVTVMSVHKSKGLEFPVVFLSGLSKGFNRQDLKPPVLCHKELGIGLSCVDMSTRVRYPALSKHAIAVRKIAESLSEELRILYVAMTRARDRLIMTYADKGLISTLADISASSVYSSDAVLSSDVKNIGEWILRAALNRTEAGSFFAVAGNTGAAKVSADPWLITLQESVLTDNSDIGEFTDLPEACDYPAQMLHDVVNFKYPHLAATVSPSKRTATQRKGREKDREISEAAAESKATQHMWRNADRRPASAFGKEFGNAVHNVFRFIDFSQCGSVEGVDRELHRLKDEGFISTEHAGIIKSDMLWSFFNSDLGMKLVSAKNVLKEFKFSLLEDASEYDPTLAEEKILLQGVVDCALIEDDGITVVDFKTDRVMQESLNLLVQKYSEQVQTYASALSRIYDLPIKAKCLYFLNINKFYWL